MVQLNNGLERQAVMVDEFAILAPARKAQQSSLKRSCRTTSPTQRDRHLDLPPRVVIDSHLLVLVKAKDACRCPYGDLHLQTRGFETNTVAARLRRCALGGPDGRERLGLPFRGCKPCIVLALFEQYTKIVRKRGV